MFSTWWVCWYTIFDSYPHADVFFLPINLVCWSFESTSGVSLHPLPRGNRMQKAKKAARGWVFRCQDLDANGRHMQTPSNGPSPKGIHWAVSEKSAYPAPDRCSLHTVRGFFFWVPSSKCNLLCWKCLKSMHMRVPTWRQMRHPWRETSAIQEYPINQRSGPNFRLACQSMADIFASPCFWKILGFWTDQSHILRPYGKRQSDAGSQLFKGLVVAGSEMRVNGPDKTMVSRKYWLQVWNTPWFVDQNHLLWADVPISSIC